MTLGGPGRSTTDQWQLRPGLPDSGITHTEEFDMFRTTALATLTLTALALPLATTAPASASDGGGGDVRTHGGCSGSAVWRLKAKPDDGRIEVEAEVDSNHSGQVWHWRIQHNGSTSAKGTGTTTGVSGSYSVERRMANLAGTDHFSFRAVRRATGQVCRGTISL
jgi:hypothetical protein